MNRCDIIIHAKGGDNMSEKLVYTVTETADRLRVSRTTVYNWIEEDKIEYSTLPNGQKRIPVKEVDKYLK